MEFDHCPCSGRTLARLLQPAVMAVLAREEAHGYGIMQRLRAMSMFRRQAPDPTGVYRLLRTMEEKNLLAAEWDTPRRGLARRRYSLTAQGRRCLRQWVATLKDYQSAIGDVLGAVAETQKAPRARRAAEEDRP
jgi:DNA-binding PadR family transcriptional regulator